MQLFLSWSGAQSRKVAEEFRGWLPMLIQAVEPWISVDIEKGRRWGAEITQRLSESRVGIVCLTRENLRAPWILFESGALSRLEGAYVCTFLLGVSAGDVEPPLGQFQHTSFTREDVRNLITTIYRVAVDAGEKVPPVSTIETLFESLWPSFETKITTILESSSSDEEPVRTEREVLEEILGLLRQQMKDPREGFLGTHGVTMLGIPRGTQERIIARLRAEAGDDIVIRDLQPLPQGGYRATLDDGRIALIRGAHLMDVHLVEERRQRPSGSADRPTE